MVEKVIVRVSATKSCFFGTCHDVAEEYTSSLKAQTVMKAMKMTSRVPTLVLVAVPLPRFLEYDFKSFHRRLI